MSTLGWKKQFCVRGHDTFICGRTKTYWCKNCLKTQTRKDPAKDQRLKQFCINGHDTLIFGRSSNKRCKQCGRDYQNTYHNLHKSKEKVSQSQWKKINREEYNAYHRERYKNNINHKLAGRIRDRLSSALKGKTKPASAIKMLGCTIDELKIHIESKFYEGMTWNNWDKHGWHIDHIIPLDSFDLTDKEQFGKACHYTNLQPLWAIDNWSKGNRI